MPKRLFRTVTDPITRHEWAFFECPKCEYRTPDWLRITVHLQEVHPRENPIGPVQQWLEETTDQEGK